MRIKRFLNTRLKASYTVEGAFIFSITILLISFMLHLSIDLYGNVKTASETPEEITEMDTLELFLGASYAQDILGTIEDGL